MKTVSLNGRKMLLGTQILCLAAIGVAFVVSPFVALAGCGGGAKQAVRQDVKILALAANGVGKPQVNSTVLNAANNGTGGVITPITAFKTSDIKNGMWVTATLNVKGTPLTFQGTVFNIKVVNGNQKVAEVWVADPTDPARVKPGTVLKNVLLPNN